MITKAQQRAYAATRAYELLQTALALAKTARAPRLIARIRFALKSAEGAARHAALRANAADSDWRCPGCGALVEPNLVRHHRDNCEQAP